MSRVGKKPILIPEGVDVKAEGQKITVKGPKGELFRDISHEIRTEKKEKMISVLPLPPKTKKTKALWGLTRTLIANMIEGVTKGYEKKMAIEGIGYKAQLEEKNLVIKIGFTHPVKIEAPEGIIFSVEKNIITISGINKELVGQISAKIRKIRPPEPYKGKGIRYFDEIVKRKLGKKAVTATGR
ncbi:MAG: 50S ribosomal protein L6 [Candidatus Nealsonbacteria bacterium RBG_13_36_15]|uniref:Large ribosomal subunit protein uL6 n=1 Tax=Candidatus Nealsonbacteria bacterium RBG_13_36_15 TaxID=1801660 RepID=A0A1G2DXG0_9BACT|nr:MAG: 50S ribosomal protein L6 [Candidatus Nealsonbacteria bacterium RBG_13_36_15]